MGILTYNLNAQTTLPDNSLPNYITHLTDFGQRPEWSIDCKQIYFLDKCYEGGEVWVVDVSTKVTRQLTKPEDRPKGHGIYRVLCLPNGDLLLACGAVRQMLYFMVMDKSLKYAPYKIDAEVLVEGPAVSRKSMNIAWTLPGQLEIYTGEIAYFDGRAKIINKKFLVNINKVVTAVDGAKLDDIIETQNWRPPFEDELTFSLYKRDKDRTKWGRSSSGSGIYETKVLGISLKTDKIVNYTKPKDLDGEPEGIFPNGKYTLMESKGEIYKLKLDGAGSNIEKLTEGFSATNPVLSDDGISFVFMTRGCHGLYLFDIQKYEQAKQMSARREPSANELSTRYKVLEKRANELFPSPYDNFGTAKSYKHRDGVILPYRLFEPAKNEWQVYPMVVFLHGSGGTGTDDQGQFKDLIVPPTVWAFPENQEKHPCYVLVLQGPDRPSWPHVRIPALKALLDSIIAANPIDPNRIYISGLSMGGMGTWAIIQEYPEYFAAAIPVCGGGDMNELEGILNNHLPIWAFHGEVDPVVNIDAFSNRWSAEDAFTGQRTLVRELISRGMEPTPKYTWYPDVGHNAWDGAYSDPSLLDWVFSQSKSD